MTEKEILHQINVGEHLPPLGNPNIQAFLGCKTDATLSNPNRFSQDLPVKMVYRQRLAPPKHIKSKSQSCQFISHILNPLQNTNMISSLPPGFEKKLSVPVYEERHLHNRRGSFKHYPSSALSTLPKTQIKENLFVMEPKPTYESYKYRQKLRAEAKKNTEPVHEEIEDTHPKKKAPSVQNLVKVESAIPTRDIKDILADTLTITSSKPHGRYFCPDS